MRYGFLVDDGRAFATLGGTRIAGTLEEWGAFADDPRLRPIPADYAGLIVSPETCIALHRLTPEGRRLVRDFLAQH